MTFTTCHRFWVRGGKRFHQQADLWQPEGQQDMNLLQIIPLVSPLALCFRLILLDPSEFPTFCFLTRSSLKQEFLLKQCRFWTFQSTSLLPYYELNVCSLVLREEKTTLTFLPCFYKWNKEKKTELHCKNGVSLSKMILNTVNKSNIYPVEIVVSLFLDLFFTCFKSF